MSAALPVDVLRDDGPVAGVLRPVVAVPPLLVAACLVVGTATVVGASLAAVRGLGLVVGVATWVVATVRPTSPRWRRTAWTVPPALRTWEYGLAVALGSRADARTGAALAFLYVLVVGYHHYDVVYRLRHRGVVPPRWLAVLLGGWELRTAVLLVAAATGTVPVVLGALVAWCGLLALGESLRFWFGSDGGADPALPMEGDAE